MLNKIRKLREKKGFTLVELIVVIAIIAILTAVLVPLIGNWTQQAAYTTLQDGAQTISNSVNNALSKVAMGGAPPSIFCIQVTKDSKGEFKIFFDGSDTATSTGESDPDTNEKIADEIKTILDATLPNGSAFLASISSGAVDAVAYRNNSGDKIGSINISIVDEFDNAYEVDATSTDPVYAIGASGKFKGNVKVTVTATAGSTKGEVKVEAKSSTPSTP